MNGSSLLLDTNIILYLLSGNKTVADILDGIYPYISFISELELLGYNGISIEEKQKIQLFLNECHIIDINDQIKKYTIGIREAHTLKLPDSIIAGTSLFLGSPLFTADKGFAKIKDFTWSCMKNKSYEYNLSLYLFSETLKEYKNQKHTKLYLFKS